MKVGDQGLAENVDTRRDRKMVAEKTIRLRGVVAITVLWVGYPGVRIEEIVVLFVESECSVGRA